MLGVRIRAQRPAFWGIVNNQHGVALIMAMIMLVLMSILGALSLSTSTTEIGISGNYKNSQETFYTADAAIERAATDSSIYTTIIPGTTNSWSNTAAWSIGSSGTVNVGNVIVQYLSSGSLPPGSGSDPEVFQAYNFLSTITASGPNSSESRLESQMARIVPK